MPKILLVEDDNNLREIYGARLSAEGYEIVSAPDGEEALAIAVKEKPDLIISDIMMPKVSGFDMLDILRNAPETKDTKIIMMTALSQAEDKERADKLGADLYLVKSQVTLEDVAASVHKILSEPKQTPAETTPPTAQPPAESAPPSQPATTPPSDSAPAAPTAPNDVAQSPVPTQPPTQPTDTKPTPVPAAPDATSAPTPPPAAPQPAPASDAQDQPAPTGTKPVAKKIEVTLPDSEDEAKDNKTSAPTPAEPAKVAEEPKPEDADFIGPSLAEALADEEKSIQNQIEDFENTPAEEPKTDAGKKPPVEPEATQANQSGPTIIKPQTTGSDDKAEDEQPPTLSDGPKGSSTPKKVIQPINDLTKGPDLDSLLAKEQANEGVQTPDANATVSPGTSKTPDKPADNPSKSSDNQDGLSKISL
jgi:CheY-like chemotaxis protein